MAAVPFIVFFWTLYTLYLPFGNKFVALVEPKENEFNEFTQQCSR